MRLRASRATAIASILARMGGASGLSPYLGQVATRSFVPNVKTGGTNAVMSRTAHTAVQAITSLQIKLPGWAVIGDWDTATASATTYTASVEYPAGTFTQIKWAGAASVVAPAGGDSGLSDAASVSIPAGAVFWIRNLANTAGNSGGGLPVTQASVSTRWTAQGEASVLSSTTTTDLTMSGTVTHGGTDAFIYPLCIVATTSAPTFLAVGDSRTIGSGMSPDINGAQGQITPSFGASYAYINCGVGGSQLANANRGFEQRKKLAQYVSHVVLGYGINDIRTAGGNRTAAQVQSDITTFGKLMAGKPLILATVAPETTSTDSWATTANQTPTANGAALATLNTWIRTQPAPYGMVLDIDAQQGDGSSPEKWKAGYTADGLHANSTGYAAIVSAGTVNGATMGALKAGGNFSILNLSPSVAWFDVGDPATAGTAGTSWLARGGRQSMAGSGTYGAASFAGGAGYTMNGASNSYLGDATYYKAFTNGLAGCTLAVLFQLSSIPASTRGLFGATVNGSNNERAFIYIDNAGKPGIVYRRLDADAASQAYSAAALSTSQPSLLVAVFDPTNNTAFLRVNGVQVASGSFLSAGAFSATNSNNVALCTLSSLFTACVLREADILSTALSASDVQKLEGDMAWRAGVAATVLPGGHPYYSAAPTS